MIRIIIELDPSDGGPNQTVGYGEIANTGTGDWRKGTYQVRLWTGEPKGKPKYNALFGGFPRLRFGIWSLVWWALMAVQSADGPFVAGALEEGDDG